MKIWEDYDSGGCSPHVTWAISGSDLWRHPTIASGWRVSRD